MSSVLTQQIFWEKYFFFYMWERKLPNIVAKVFYFLNILNIMAIYIT